MEEEVENGIGRNAGQGAPETLRPRKLSPAETTPELAAQIAELHRRLDRCDLFEGRIALLEKMLAPSAVDGEPGQRKLKWLPCDSVQSQSLSPELEAALLQNLLTFAPFTITLQSLAGDAAARQRAAWLKSIFERAKWTVHGPKEASAHARDRGLVFAVGALPLPDAAAATLLALTAAGFLVVSRLDPHLRGDEALLIVG